MRQYSFSNTIVVINGVEIVGWSEGDDVISIKRRVDSVTDKVGASGEMMVSISADKSGEFSFKLQQTSPSNNFLNNLCALQEVGSFVPISVRWMDLFRQDLATGGSGYIKKPAEMKRGAMASDQEWMVVAEQLDQVLGSINL